MRRRVALRSSLVGVAVRADGCLPSGGRARSESISATCAIVGWVLSIRLIDLPFSHWTHVTFKQVGGQGEGVLSESPLGVWGPGPREGTAMSGAGSAVELLSLHVCVRVRACACIQRERGGGGCDGVLKKMSLRH